MIAPLLLAAGAITSPVLSVQQIRQAPTAEVWTIDQLRLPRDTPQSVLAALEPDHSMAAVIRRLTALGVPFKRVRLNVAPDRLAPQLRELIRKMPPGEPFVAPENGFIGVNVLIGRKLPSDMVWFTPPTARPAPFQKA